MYIRKIIFRLRAILIAVMFIAAISVTAETVDCVTIETTDGTQQFAISDIKEVTFADDGVTVIKNDGSSYIFASGWQMLFGTTELSVRDIQSDASLDAPAYVYTVDGRLVTSYHHLSGLRHDVLAPGTYLVVSNGKNFKIQR